MPTEVTTVPAPQPAASAYQKFAITHQPTIASTQSRSAPHPSMVTLWATCFIGRPMQHDAIRRSVAEGTKHRPLKFTAGNEAPGAGLSDNPAVVVHDLSATDSRLRKSGDVHARIRRVHCIRELVLIL